MAGITAVTDGHCQTSLGEADAYVRGPLPGWSGSIVPRLCGSQESWRRRRDPSATPGLGAKRRPPPPSRPIPQNHRHFEFIYTATGANVTIIPLPSASNHSPDRSQLRRNGDLLYSKDMAMHHEARLFQQDD
ncbi:hypothetical protein AAFF_G00141870 [Aldrovandia affinis]|uniref:Uncharacterized protein n=1 Tax=Aldrovandia affinis TaxID=143900 RepID=A0AAD7TCW8_9TELE|nr:hypothetical protein AAFF_G00141870 [Aldrovandia affinis]